MDISKSGLSNYPLVRWCTPLFLFPFSTRALSSNFRIFRQFFSKFSKLIPCNILIVPLALHICFHFVPLRELNNKITSSCAYCEIALGSGKPSSSRGPANLISFPLSDASQYIDQLHTNINWLLVLGFPKRILLDSGVSISRLMWELS